MANNYPYLVMTAIQAAHIREASSGDEYRLDPQEVPAGPHKGKFVLAAKFKTAPEYQSHWDALNMLTEVSIDRDEAWPPSEDELAARRAAE